MGSSSIAYRTPPIQPGVAPDANYLMRDLDFQFMRMIRTAPAVPSWHKRFAWEPSQAFASLRVDMPIDLSSFSIEKWTGIPTFRKGTNTKMRLEIEPFWSGSYVNVKELEDPNSNALVGFEQRSQSLFNAWDRHLQPKIYKMLTDAESDVISGGHPVTGALHFFDTGHYFNIDHKDFGTFDNIIGNGGANASTPIYAVLGGGVFDMMKPWAILKGTNLEGARQRAREISSRSGVTTGGGNGEPWIIHWGATDDKTLIEQNFEVRMGIYAERGFGLLFPHMIIRFEGTLDYAGLCSIVDAARGMKDLNGYLPADQTTIAAFLVDNAAQKRTIDGLLGRELTDNTSSGVKIDPMLQGAPVIIMSR